MKAKLKALPLIFAAVMGVLLLICPTAAVGGVSEGLRLSAGVIIPSLFPFLVVSSFAADCPASSAVSKAFSPVMRLVFRLPGEAATAVAFGLIGGFPVGCSVAAGLLESGRISREQAQRLTLFCVNAGPAFVITAVGAVMLGSRRAGVIIFASLSIACLLIGFFLRFFGSAHMTDNGRKCSVSVSTQTTSQALVNATQKSTTATLKICSWLTLFSCMASIAQHLGLSGAALGVTKCLLEVTSGCTYAAKEGNLFVVAAVLGWSGLCVGCQVLEYVRSVGTPLPLFFAFRAVNGALAAVICFVLLKFFPLEQTVFSNVTSAVSQTFSFSAPACAALIFLCVVFVIDLDRNRKVC